MSDEQCCDNVKSAEGPVGLGCGSTYVPTFWDKYSHKLYQAEAVVRPIVYILVGLALVKYIVG